MKLLRLAGRLVVIGFVVWLCAVRYFFGRIGTLFVPGGERRRAAVARLRGRVLRSGMESLGATFIKLGQVMSTRPDLFEPELIEELRVLQDRLPPFPTPAARRLVEEDLGPRASDLVSFEDPVAAGSVAQVHRATLQGGHEVAVKVLRPEVRDRVERDAAILLAWAGLLEVLPSARASAPREHLAHFVRGIIDQTDLRMEAANYARFRKNFEKFGHVAVDILEAAPV